MAESVVVPPGGGDKNEVGDQTDCHDCPYHATHQVSMSGLDQGERLDGVADAQVTVHADAGEKEDAAVEVCIEEVTNCFAGCYSEWPVAAVGVVVDEGGKREDVKEVGQGQVKHKHCAWVPRTHLHKEPQSCSIEHETKHKHQTVGHG